MIKAIKNRIFLKKDQLPEKIGSLYMPASDAAPYGPPYVGVILSIGPNVTDEDLKIGTKIMFNDTVGTSFEYDGEDIFSIRDNDVIGIILNNNLRIH